MTTIDVIILFLSATAAATISGASGFGGALVLLPIVTHIVGIQAAIPILTIGQLFGNASRVYFNHSSLEWKPIVLFLITALPLTLIGSYMFSQVNGNKIKIGVGIFLILLVIYRRLKLTNKHIENKGMLLGGGLTGFISGIAGSAGPIGAAFFLGLGLSPTAYIASEAFTALSMHITKSFMYSKFDLIGQKEIALGLIIGVAMILGSWLGKEIINRLSQKSFIFIVEALLVVSGIQLIITGIYN